jgi:transcription elongation factor Elf1
MSLLRRFLAWLNSKPEPLQFDEVEADCPNCGHFQIHQIKQNYFLICKKCGHQQYKDEAITREESAW